MAEQVPGMAEAIEGRMKQLALTPTAVEARSGLSNPQCVEVRSGRRKGYQDKTRFGFARALCWPEDWYDRLVAGEDWTAFPHTDWPATDRSQEERLASLEARMDELPQVGPQVSWGFCGAL